MIKDLNSFFDEYVQQPQNGVGETSYWHYILFYCQNSINIKLYLGITDRVYSGADRHAAYIFGGIMSLTWCLAEISTRFLALGIQTQHQYLTTAVISSCPPQVHHFSN